MSNDIAVTSVEPIVPPPLILSPRDSCSFFLIDTIFMDVMSSLDLFDSYDWTILRHVSKAVRAMVPPASPSSPSLDEALVVVGTEASYTEYFDHLWIYAPWMGFGQAFLRRPRDKNDFKVMLEFLEEIEYITWHEDFMDWCLVNLKEPSGFFYLYQMKERQSTDEQITSFNHTQAHGRFREYVRKHLMYVIVEGTSAFVTQAKMLLTDSEDLGTKDRLEALLNSEEYGLVEKLVAFNPKLAGELLGSDEPEVAQIYAKFCGEDPNLEITELLFGDEPSDLPWLRAMLEHKKSLVQETLTSAREAQEDDEDWAGLNFEDQFDVSVLKLLKEFGLL